MTGEPLPLLLSVPHAGLAIPAELRPFNMLDAAAIAADGDVGAATIYDLADLVAAYETTDIARAFVDLNRADDDRRKDGVVKTHTCWDLPIYRTTPPDDVFARVLDLHHRPYHEALSRHAADPGLVLGLDCHTMAAVGPPVGPDPGQPRPMACLGDVGGTSCPRPWVDTMLDCLGRFFPGEVVLNKPFAGGFNTRHHGREMPWLQLELSRSDIVDDASKRQMVKDALCAFAAEIDPTLGRPWPP